MQIEEKAPFATLYEWIGGEDRVKALVERFYDLMDLESDFARLREVHGPSLAKARQNTVWFLCGWMGGPQYYTEKYGHPRLRITKGAPDVAQHILQKKSPDARAGVDRSQDK